MGKAVVPHVGVGGVLVVAVVVEVPRARQLIEDLGGGLHAVFVVAAGHDDHVAVVDDRGLARVVVAGCVKGFVIIGFRSLLWMFDLIDLLAGLHGYVQIFATRAYCCGCYDRSFILIFSPSEQHISSKFHSR